MLRNAEGLEERTLKLAKEWDDRNLQPAGELLRTAVNVAKAIEAARASNATFTFVSSEIPSLLQVKIRRELIAAFIERDENRDKSGSDRMIDLTLARIINGRFGAELDDFVPLEAVRCPNAEHSDELLLEMGLESASKVRKPYKTGLNRSINLLEDGGLTSIGGLRALNLGTAIIPGMTPETLQIMQSSFVKTQPSTQG